MKRPLALLIVVLLVLAACTAPAATPATQAPAAPQGSVVTKEVVVQVTSAPAAAQPTQPLALPTQAPAPALQPTLNPLATALPELRPPQSGGALTPPTVIPTLSGNNSVTSGQLPPIWATYRDQVTGLTFQYPSDWQTAVARNSKSTLVSIVVARPGQPITNTSSIVIDVRKKQGDLLTWLSQQLPTGLLLIDAKALENPSDAKSYNARVGNNQAVFIYAPTHGKLDDVAELHTGDNHYFYQVTYLGSTPDDLDDRAAFLHLLNTLTLPGTTSSGVTLPVTTTFSSGIDPAQWK
ncbi:MAG TPA: hypothetical protein VMP08_09450 [Anaerolineae bacterium]|nr:hypothetical protein [Anaerolineae bacterium]